MKRSLNTPPLKLLANITMEGAYPVDELARIIFPSSDNQGAERALTALMTFGSLAKISDRDAGLLPCRIHSFHRGLPGLWACVDPECSALSPHERGGPTGRLFSQPRDLCLCGARVFELFTCRNCGTAYARALY